MWKKKKYDIIVVGAGPAGSTFARLTASKGLTVLLLDKKKKIGTPVRCGEAVAVNDLHTFFQPRKEWITTTIDTFCFVPPDENVITINLKQKGYILDRKVFDKDLAELAQDEGVTIITDAYVNDVIMESDYVKGVKGICNNEPFAIESKLVIAADGVEGRIARFAGIKTRLSIRDIDSGYEKTISNIQVEPNTGYFYFASDLAPGGYVWVFPKSSQKANIGIGIAASKYEEKNSAKIRLDKFLQLKFPTHTIDSTTLGGIILSKPLKKMVANGIMLIGDAARTVDPLTGGGIIWGMRSGEYAANVAVDIMKHNREASETNLLGYQNKWMQNEGKQIRRLYRFKEIIYNIEDSELNRIADKVNGLPPDKRTFFNLFKISFQNRPSLVLELAKQFIGI